MRWFPTRLLLLIVALATATLPALPQTLRRRPGEGYALLIAVRQYEPSELRSLKYTEADVEGMADVLAKSGYPRANIRVMSQERARERARLLPTGANIRSELRLMLKNIDESDRVVVALAGHGVQLSGSEESYFCPADARLEDRSTLIPLAQVYVALESCGAGSKVLLVDACRNDPLTERARAAGRPVVDLASLSRPLKKRSLGGVAALFSCSGGEKAYEDPELKHGVFFHFVIKGLEGEADFDQDGVVDLDELSAYAKKRVYRYVEGEYHVEQTPELVGKGNLMELARLVRADVPSVERKAEAPKVERSMAKPELASRTPSQPPADEPPVPKSITNTIGMKLVLIKAGEFEMGSGDEDKEAFADEKPRHRVRITRPFYLGSTEVTQGQYQAVRGANPSGFKGSDDLPVEQVSWDDAISFCNTLSEREGLKPYYQFGNGAQSGGDGYRLPTEAEWEYACRAGSSTRYSFGDDAARLGEYAWFEGNSDSKTHTVGQKRANAFGLFDMHGNVREWCWDVFDAEYYAKSPAADPSGPLQAAVRVDRGGGWIFGPRDCRAALRGRDWPGNRFDYLGFRVARVRSGS